MKKKYNSTLVEILPKESFALMIPGTGPGEPGLAPKRNWVPDPGASYDPQGSVV